MLPSSDRYTQFANSPHPWETDAVHFLRDTLLDSEPNRIWALFEFTSRDGTIGEVDSLVLTAKGFYLVEIKSRPGRVTGDSSAFTWTHDGRRYTDDNPVLLANRKCKRLIDLLSRQRALQGMQLPFLEPLIFLSHETNSVEIDASTNRSVCTRKGGPNTLSLQQALSHVAADHIGRRARIDGPMARAIQLAMAQAGIKPSPRQKRFGTTHELDRLLLDGPNYQDWLAHHLTADRVKRRIRIYPVAQTVDPEQRKILHRAAQREFQALNGLQHDGILRALNFEEGDQGPGLVFDYEDDQVRLDHFLRDEGDALGLGDRLQILRQVAEAIRHAHDRRVVHRALSPQSVLIRRKKPSGFETRVYNWQTASRDSTTSGGSLHATQHIESLVDPATVPYLAPETQTDPTSRAEHLDLFGLGGIAFLLFANRPPAEDRASLIDRLGREDGFLLSASVDNCASSLVDLVRIATRPRVLDRYSSVAEFLQQLDEVENELTRPDDEVHQEPTQAKAGQRFPGGWIIKNRLGQGSTAVVFLVERDPGNGKTEERVLKLALSPEKNATIAAEREVLGELHHEAIVKCDGSLQCAGHDGILLARAGEEALSNRLRKGPLPLEQLQRFGADLMSALCYLETEGVFHRDIKPDNLGIATRRRGDFQHLVLFDFSLARAPLSQVLVGTRAYLDPFLGAGTRRQYDSAAERYAAAVTLFEMATGRLPRWGDGLSLPALTNDEVDLKDESLFPPELRDAMTGFFRRAFQRDAKKRFDNGDEMRRAWDAVFEESQPVAPPTLRTEITLRTPVQLLGASTRVMTVLERQGIETVKQLLEVPQGRLTKGRGVGARTREELLRLLDELRKKFPNVEPKTAGPAGADGQSPPVDDEEPSPAQLGTILPLDELVTALLLKGAGTAKANQAAQALRDLIAPPDAAAGSTPWPTQSEVARKHGITAVVVSQALTRARQRWAKVSTLTSIRTAFVGLLGSHGGVATVEEGVRLVADQFGGGLVDAERLPAARAVLRAAMETEVADQNRFGMARRQDQVFLVANETVQREPIDEDALLQYAIDLGRKAAQLAEQEPLPAPTAVLQRLQEVRLPAGVPPIGPERLLRLAASAGKVAVAGNFSLYPIGMPSERALKLAFNVLLGSPTLTPMQIRERIRSRFPDAEALPTDPSRLQQLLRDLVPDLKWDGEQQVFRFQSESRPLLTGHQTLPARRTTDRLPLPDDPERVLALEFDRRLGRALDKFLILTTLREQHETVLGRLTTRFPTELAVVSCERLFLDRLREMAQKRRVDWQRVLLADQQGAAAVDQQKLRQLVEMAVGNLGDEIGKDFGSGRTILLTRMGLLARFGLVTKVVNRLRERSQVPPDSPGALRGTWLLVASSDDTAAPRLDGEVIPVPGGLTDYARVPVGWIQGLVQEQAS